MTDAQRLDDVEDELETVKQVLLSTARYAESANQRIDRLIERQDSTQKQLDSLAVTVQVMGERVDAFISKTDAFISKTDAFISKTDAFVSKTDDFIETTQARNAVFGEVILRLEENHASTNAAIERLERILVRLIPPNES
ncbi:hypothetical protein [Nostoc sp. TCL26-01]|uniref:hypothetical protein n=1 Tax=Nostoc sp. TCL26-01 TaxID=2576904 RepID=UPI0015BB7C5A|nr:hypothetical protein [Nostoc sp. TCL26-01]QLE58217.1 hypothetical protein FD725_23495 [Nostoc sp. TCL26-01]